MLGFITFATASLRNCLLISLALSSTTRFATTVVLTQPVLTDFTLKALKSLETSYSGGSGFTTVFGKILSNGLDQDKEKNTDLPAK